MGNMRGGVKRSLFSKNVVTILGIVVSFAILFIGYTTRINSSIKPITVPYAKEKIASGVQITSKMVGTTQVPPSMLEGDVITSVSSVVDKYSNADTMIPKGSLFYKRTVVDKEDLPANIILDYPSGYVLYNLGVNTTTTYGNSIYPGNYIDIYLKVETENAEGTVTNTDDEDKVMLGKLLSNVKVISVKDSNGLPVFEDTSKQRSPAMVIFAIPEEYYILLKKAEFLRTYKSTLIPVPTNESLKDSPGDLEISSESLKQWINNVTVWTDN